MFNVECKNSCPAVVLTGQDIPHGDTAEVQKTNCVSSLIKLIQLEYVQRHYGISVRGSRRRNSKTHTTTCVVRRSCASFSCRHSVIGRSMSNHIPGTATLGRQGQSVGEFLQTDTPGRYEATEEAEGKALTASWL